MSPVAYAQQGITLAQVLARARADAPQVLSAVARIEETRAQMIGARLRARDNPVIDATVGPRSSDLRQTTDWEFTGAQVFEPSSRRSARIRSAQSAIERDAAAADDTRRRALEAAASLFYRVLQARERAALMVAAESLSQQTVDIAQRRYRAGDIAVLDVNIASAALSRARAERQRAEADRRDILGDLRVLLDIPDSEVTTVAGEFSAGPVPDLPGLLQSASRRPDLRALAAERENAVAEVSVGQSFRRPDWGWTARYAREDQDRILMGGLSFTMPLFNKGQEQIALGLARRARATLELETTRRAIEREVRTAYEVLQMRAAAVMELQENALKGADANDALARRSYEVGELRLADWLLIRRELLDARVALLDARTETALARIRLESAAGVLQ
jgi:cobalt-zinc-cadmium efflux system outer membrane protein